MANVGMIDRVLRACVGAFLIALPLIMATPEQGMVAYGTFGWVMVAAGIVMLLTAAFRFCPLYLLLGVRTCPLSK
ncbi:MULTISPECIES: DUF2892 domain-containing protein [Thalassospira]|jgi:predicted phage tail protein|uniref:DUF2892 domain-containing protein n=1 Tax=Thalassospira povalilytica TaxID=732237 RepID=A0A8I1SK20_9PROT|nr:MULTISPECIES: DUF2892 domain-containing protein [Thalassospira]MEE3044340.1 DUF2892 domain-containing protein [Pseudomonadota bacterium]RCK21304.1 hypothetical protein TH8_17785 [Thalassospira profundimaris]KZB68877.1 hypothetical protein AUQ42_11685 [Thalassospira sp. MCCC 1A02491]MAL40625.1 DUF2892 domain-containing protein [Thalassospira sp.]MBN8197573.1 DUF2892 domain-containing protein [Thalassospira povalilytica]